MEEKPTVYIETTIPSFLTARPSNNLVVAGKQEVTRQWWDKRREKYSLFVSPFVLDEVSIGNSDAARRRLEALEDIALLAIDVETVLLTQAILASNVIPLYAATDAGHIAVAARHGMDYLITWNCAHIANAEIQAKINYRVIEMGYFLPTICTPDALFGGEDNHAG